MSVTWGFPPRFSPASPTGSAGSPFGAGRPNKPPGSYPGDFGDTTAVARPPGQLPPQAAEETPWPGHD